MGRGCFPGNFHKIIVYLTKDELMTYHEVPIREDDNVSFGSNGVHCNVLMSLVKMNMLYWDDNEFNWSGMWHDKSMF